MNKTAEITLFDENERPLKRIMFVADADVPVVDGNISPAEFGLLKRGLETLSTRLPTGS